jgi:hypothetical protein
MGVVDDRPLALGELEGRAHRLERQEDVGEEDRRVDPRRSGWSVTSSASSGVRQISSIVCFCAERAVLGHVAAGLAHEPHGRAVDGFAPAGAEEGVVHGPYPTQSRAG